VRRLLAQHQLDPRDITGTGRDGRITHQDVLANIEGKSRAPAPKPAPPPVQAPVQSSKPQAGSKRIPHTNMRRAIAEHMSRSLSTAPHVTAVFEADFSAIIADRTKRKAQGQELTYTAYFVVACVKALEAVPQVNSRWHENEVEIFPDFNIGVGTALGDAGLVVPVIRKAQNLTLLGIADVLGDLTRKARANKLTPAEMQGGTFTISNHGVSGSLVATPIIINQPQSAILGIGKLEKRVVVKELDGQDTIAIRPMAYVSLTIDHRVIDGFQTNAFLTKWVEVIENWK
jgi:2-oxoglutarate dehydrogenase E2 component (dihydrolipoamide succinyltransferase)